MGKKKKKSFMDYVKTAIDAIKAAKFLYSIIGVLGLWAGYTAVTMPVVKTDPIEAVQEPVPAKPTVIEHITAPKECPAVSCPAVVCDCGSRLDRLERFHE